MLIELLTTLSINPAAISAPMALTSVQESVAGQSSRSKTRDMVLVAKAESTMQTLASARGRFAQTDWDGTRSLGRFAIQKPGKMRFDYSDETLVVIADGVTLAVTDRELETTDSVPLAATPLGAILSGKKSFRETTNIVETHRVGDHFYVSLEDKGDDWNGVLSLKFNLNDSKLVGWVTSDETGATTQVDLYEVDSDPKLNPRLFIIED